MNNHVKYYKSEFLMLYWDHIDSTEYTYSGLVLKYIAKRCRFKKGNNKIYKYLLHRDECGNSAIKVYEKNEEDDIYYLLALKEKVKISIGNTEFTSKVVNTFI